MPGEIGGDRVENLPADLELADHSELVTEKELEVKLAKANEIADAWKDEEGRFKREIEDHKLRWIT